MKAVILANGEATRWRNYKGMTKQLIKINGETLLDRMARLLKENGVNDILIAGNFDIKGCKSINTVSKTKRECFVEVAEIVKEPFILLNGDVYYTEEIIKDAVKRDNGKWLHWCCPYQNIHTGKRWGEGYIHKVIDVDWWIKELKEFNEKVNNREINLQNDWTINHYLAKKEDIYKPVFTMGDLNEYDVYWCDETDDFDYPEDLDLFLFTTGYRSE